MFVISELEVSGFLIASASCVVFWVRKRESLFPGASHFIRQMSSPWVNKICKPKERISQQDQLRPTKVLRSFILPQALVVKFFWFLIEPINKTRVSFLYTRRTLFVYLAKRYKLLVNNLDKEKSPPLQGPCFSNF